MRAAALAVLLVVSGAGVSRAGNADVLATDVSCRSPSVCRFSVTLQHADEGWQHYADRWEILTPEGELLATRVLQHPHVSEQPFTRSLQDVTIPEGLTHVRLRAHDSVHGHRGAELLVEIPR